MATLTTWPYVLRVEDIIFGPGTEMLEGEHRAFKISNGDQIEYFTGVLQCSLIYLYSTLP